MQPRGIPTLPEIRIPSSPGSIRAHTLPVIAGSTKIRTNGRVGPVRGRRTLLTFRRRFSGVIPRHFPTVGMPQPDRSSLNQLREIPQNNLPQPE